MEQHYSSRDAFFEYRRNQSKFEYFFLAIIIGVLSISVQTFQPTNNTHSVYLMVVTWILLIVSLVLGLFRLERINQFLYVESAKLSSIERKKRIEMAIQGGLPIGSTIDTERGSDTIQEEIKLSSQITALAGETMNAFGKHILVAYQWQKWSFLLSIFTFCLFKITNLYHLLLVCEVASIVTVILIGVGIVKLYKKSLPKFSDIEKES